MAGTSGCIPDYQVNFFGQLCKPVSQPSAMTTPELEPEVDVDNQTNDKQVQSHTAVQAPESDPIAKLFNENQALIRGFSLGSVETYLSTVKEIFAEVRRSRANACLELPQGQQLAEHHQIEHYYEHQAGQQGQHQIKQHDQRHDRNRDQDQDQQQLEYGFAHQDQHQAQHEDQPQLQNHHQPQNRYQSPPKDPANRFIVTHYPKDKSEDKVPRRSRLQREEDAMYCIEYYMPDGEMGNDEFLWLDALLMANFTGDPKRKYGFDQVWFDE